MRVFGRNIRYPTLLLAAADFGLALLGFMVAVYLLRSLGRATDVVASGAAGPWALGFGVAVVVGVTAMGLYQPRQRLRIEGALVRLAVALLIAVVVLALISFVFAAVIERALWGSSIAITWILLSAVRVLFWKIIEHDSFRRRVLVYGAGQRSRSLLSLRRRSDQRGFKIVAFMPAPGDRQVVDDPRVISANIALLPFVREQEIDEIIMAMDDRRTGFPIKDLLDCRFNGVQVVDLITFLERETGKVKIDVLNPSWLIFSEGFATDPLRNMYSRALDLVASVAIGIVALPVMALVALAILIEDGRPIFYRQRRVGLMGVEFTVYKFRSMIKNAEAAGAQWAGAQDSRITRVGSITRKLRLDELPQIFNVFRGEMSLVGPRPERPEFVERLVAKIPYYHERHCVKPGITGWAQLCYPYGSSDEDAMEKLQFDLYYVKHRSLIFDLMVLLQTAEVVLWGKGAR
jgi:sugar transferase (PEP-CTERM system associated)